MTQDLVDQLRAVDEESMYQFPASTYAIVNAAADTIEAQACRIETLTTERDKLKRPNLFWIDEDPESGYIDPWEAAETALYHSDDEGIVAIREGREIGIRYYARLRADDEIGIDEDWLHSFDSHAEADAAIQTERKRRAALHIRDGE